MEKFDEEGSRIHSFCHPDEGGISGATIIRSAAHVTPDVMRFKASEIPPSSG